MCQSLPTSRPKQPFATIPTRTHTATTPTPTPKVPQQAPSPLATSATSAPERPCASAAGRRQVGPTHFDVQNMCAPQRFEPATLSLGRLMSGAADQLLQLSVLLNLEL